MPRRMRSPTVVILVDHGFVSGGQSKVAIESALGLALAGATPIFLCARGPVDPRLARAGVETICLDQHDILDNPSRAAAAVQGMWNAKAAAALAELLARLPCENTIVHAHGWAKALSPSIAKPIRASKLPAVYTMHEYFLACPNGGFYNFQKRAVCAMKAMSAPCWATNCDSRNYSFKLWRNARLAVARGAGKLERFFFLDAVAIGENLQVRKAVFRVERADRALGHHAQQQRMHLRARAVDLVEEEHRERLAVRQQRTRIDARASVAVDVSVIDEILRHQVDRAFDALVVAAEAARDCAQQRRLADADVAFEQHVAAREDRDRDEAHGAREAEHAIV